MSYSKCSSKIIKDTIDEFKASELKLKNNKVVKDKKQAIAIALSTAQKKCKYSPDELDKLRDNIDVFLLKKSKLSTDLPLSNVIQTKEIIKNYIEKKNYKKSYHYLSLLIEKIMDNNDNISKNIIKELKDLPKVK